MHSSTPAVSPAPTVQRLGLRAPSLSASFQFFSPSSKAMYSSHASPLCFPWAAPGAFICILLSSTRVARTLVLTQGGQTRSSPHSIFAKFRRLVRDVELCRLYLETGHCGRHFRSA